MSISYALRPGSQLRAVICDITSFPKLFPEVKDPQEF